MTGFTEASTIEPAIIERLSQPDLGWTYIHGPSLNRTTDGVLIESDLIDALLRLNPEIRAVPSRVDEILPILRAVVLSANTDGLVAANERMVTWMRGARTHKYMGTDAYVPVRLIDFDDLSNNCFVVSNQVTVGVGPKARRFDIVLWLNGLPVVPGETKSPVNAKESWLTGANDIHNVYETEWPSFFVPNILSFATEGREFHYGAVRQLPQEWLMWGSTEDPYDLDQAERVMRSVELLLHPAQLLAILRDFTLYDRPLVNGKPTHVKLIPRYPQVEGADAIYARVNDPTRQRGLLWHYQGSGKTLLMAFAALKLLNDESIGGPTVLMVLDRIELVEQTVRQFTTVGLPTLRVAATKEDLRRMLAQDERGIIVTTIFRFEGAGFLNNRSNIIVMVDEAHRTQEGRLGTDMRTALPQAQFFGLTGTPIADLNRNTFKLFGEEDDPGWVLNQYSMERSITDGSSVPIHVEGRLVEYHVDRESLDEAFAAMADEESLSDAERELLSERAARAQTIMRNPERVRKVCTDIVEHYLTKVAPLGLKAQVVAFDRQLCVLYFDEITRILEQARVDLEAAVVMTTSTTKSEPPEWRDRFGLTNDQEAALKARFSDPSDPLAFLIVTSKLLTGFNAPIEGVMYLDKPLRLHTLFQAITRTNRRWTNPFTGQEKLFGLIVDYVGLGNDIAAALKAADPEFGGRRPVDVEGLVTELEAAIAVALSRFDGIDRSDFSFAALQAAQQRIPQGAQRENFAQEFMHCEGLWEFLSPSSALDPYRDDYRWLAKVYESVKPTGVSDALLWQRLGQKTLELVHGHISGVRVRPTALDDVIVDEATIEAIRQLALPNTEVANPTEPLTVAEALDTIAARIQRRIESSGHHPVFVALSARLERLRLAQVQQAKASQDFLKQLLDLATEVTAAEKADDAGALNLLPDPNVGALTQILKEYAPPETPVIIENVVNDIDTIVRQVSFDGWETTQTGDRLVRREVRNVLHKYGLPTTGELFDKAYAYIHENY